MVQKHKHVISTRVAPKEKLTKIYYNLMHEIGM